jgi:hypothetical protein
MFTRGTVIITAIAGITTATAGFITNYRTISDYLFPSTEPASVEINNWFVSDVSALAGRGASFKLSVTADKKGAGPLRCAAWVATTNGNMRSSSAKFESGHIYDMAEFKEHRERQVVYFYFTIPNRMMDSEAYFYVECLDKRSKKIISDRLLVRTPKYSLPQ